MAFTRLPATPEPTSDAIASLPGATMLEFGTGWCGHCMAAEPFVEAALNTRPEVRHIRIEDGRGHRLGRLFRVKLWPTLVFLHDGVEVARIVRPTDERTIRAALAQVDATPRDLPAPDPAE